ncbi:MAG: exonuclease domain-containing protein [Flavobacteriales bacterium]
MKLKLEKPIVFFDLETTGVNIAIDRIVEISLLRIDPGEDEELKTHRINPTVPIPEEASAIHGIYNEDVKEMPTFKELAEEIGVFIDGCDLAGYNSNHFDIPLLAEEFLRAGFPFHAKGRRMVDVQNIFHKMEQRTLSAAYRFYCGEELLNAHSADADTRATYEILKAQLDRYNKLENDIAFLHDFSSRSERVDFAGRFVLNDSGVPVFNFGKYKGRPVKEVLAKDTGYYGWIMQGEFPLYTKMKLREMMEETK